MDTPLFDAEDRLMIRVYYLPMETIDGTEQVAGIEYIHHAILDIEDNLRKLIMDTLHAEHLALAERALEWHDATQEEIDRYNSLVIITPPDPDTIRAVELLATSPDVITQPEIWELLRIFGRRLGYKFD